MATSRELREKRARVIEQMKEAVKLGDEARAKGETASDYDDQFTRAVADEERLSKQIAAIERIEEEEKRAAGQHIEDQEREGRAGNDTGKKKEYREAFRRWFIHGMNDLTNEERALLTEKRGTSNQVVGTTTLGGYTVDTEIFNEIDRAQKAYSGIAQAARFIPTSGYGTLYVPTEDDTSTAANLIAEAAAITVQDLTFGQKQLDAYKYATQMKISWELMQDSAFNMVTEITNSFAPRFGRAMNASCTTGTGSSQPNGFMTAATLGKTAASATAITFGEIVDLIHSVDPAYRMSNSCGFMLHDSVLAAVKKLAIGSGDARPLWQPSVRDGEPDRIEGYKYWINQDMDSALTTGKKVMAFGDFSKYVIRLVQDMVVIRLNERYADNGLVGFVGHMRWDGELLNTAAIKYYQLA